MLSKILIEVMTCNTFILYSFLPNCNVTMSVLRSVQVMKKISTRGFLVHYCPMESTYLALGPSDSCRCTFSSLAYDSVAAEKAK